MCTVRSPRVFYTVSLLCSERYRETLAANACRFRCLAVNEAVAIAEYNTQVAAIALGP